MIIFLFCLCRKVRFHEWVGLAEAGAKGARIVLCRSEINNGTLWCGHIVVGRIGG